MARRKRQPNSGKWDHAVSPLQRARHDRRWHQDEACLAIRRACPGHTGKACKLEASKLSEFENHRRTPSLVHIQAMCETYQQSAEDLGLINWRKHHGTGATTAADHRNYPGQGKYSNVQFRTYGVYPDSDLESLVYTLRGDDLTQFASLAGGTEGSAAVDRNKFLKGMGAAAGAAATDPFIALTQIDRAALNTTTISATALEELEQAAYLHARGYYDMHLPGHVEVLVSDWSAAGRLLRQSQTPSQRIRLSESYARLSGILGFYSFDNGQTLRAEALYASAEEAAREAANNDLLAWLYDRHAQLFNSYVRRDPRARATMAERGLDASGHTETLTTARLHGVAATSYAQIGDRRLQAAHHGESARILSEGVTGCWPYDRGMPRGFSYTTDSHVSSTASAHLGLGDYPKAIAHYGETLRQKEKLLPPTASSLPLSRFGLATALMRSGELAEATHTATTAVQEFGGFAKPVVLSRARNFGTELTAADTSGTYARGFSEFLREHAPPPSVT